MKPLILDPVDLHHPGTQTLFEPKVIYEIMARVINYQLAWQQTDEATSKADINYEWIRGVFYTGVLPAWEVTKDDRFLEAALKYGESRNWQLDIPDTRHADWQCVGQLYLELYFLRREPKMLEAIKQNIDAQMAAAKPGRVDWWWCDALYMAPPVLARLHAATGDDAYLRYLDTMFWDAYDFLYDPAEQLFYRDEKYFGARTANGQKVFWSRGNGWVVGGLARVLQYLPADWPTLPRYEKLFVEMMERILTLQQPDGLWRPSLLDPDEFPMSETSGSAFFTYAALWGVNSGLLPGEKFLHSACGGWAGLMAATSADGRLGYVQVVAAAPGPVDPDDTREYAAGALLLAGAELTKAISRAAGLADQG